MSWSCYTSDDGLVWFGCTDSDRVAKHIYHISFTTAVAIQGDVSASETSFSLNRFMMYSITHNTHYEMCLHVTHLQALLVAMQDMIIMNT